MSESIYPSIGSNLNGVPNFVLFYILGDFLYNYISDNGEYFYKIIDYTLWSDMEGFSLVIEL